MTHGSPSKVERRTSYIYALLDPTTLQPRYVGKTVQSPQKRLKQHLDCARTTVKPVYRDQWIRSLAKNGLVPEVEIIETGLWTIDETDAREQHWIVGLRELGAKLTNIGAGGEGNRGHKWSPESSERLAKAMRQRFDNEAAETKARRSALMKEIWATDEELMERHRQGLRERWANPNYKARQTFASEEYRAEHKRRMKEVHNRPEARRYISAGARAQHAMRRECIDCGLVTSPAPMGSHLKSSGHSGYTDLTVYNGGGE